MRDEVGRKIACGEPIRSYFPAVISEDLFYQVQAGMRARFRVLGRPGEYETNLFTGIVFHAEDRTKMSVHTFRQATTPGGRRGLTATSLRGPRPTARSGEVTDCHSPNRRSSRPCFRRSPS